VARGNPFVLGRRGKEGWFHQFGFGMPCARQLMCHVLDRTRMNQCRRKTFNRTGIAAASRYSRHELLLHLGRMDEGCMLTLLQVKTQESHTAGSDISNPAAPWSSSHEQTRPN